MRILLTGATGFLGSHIAEALLADGNELLLLKRSTSKLSNCLQIQQKVSWLDNDNVFWIKEAIVFKPEVIIHCAWSGVTVTERDDWNVQLSNLTLMEELLQVARMSCTKQIICLGSQAEYGEFRGCVDESYPLNPTTKYGIMKLVTLQILRSFAVMNNVEWQWLRVFSVYGERESINWLIPGFIHKILSGETSMDCTKGEQIYSYLYVKDFAKAVSMVVGAKNKSGIYNVSSSKSIRIIDLLHLIKKQICPDFQLRIGLLPYQQGQSMCMLGNIDKFVSTFGKYEESTLKDQLPKLITYYKNEI